MSFLKEFFHHPPSHPEYQGPPQPPPPWIAEFDGQSQRWYFVNQQTGERTWDFPQPQGYGGDYGRGSSYAPQEEHKSHAGRNTALAAAAGLAGGAFLMHEGEKVEDRFDYDKERFEDRVDYDANRFENGVENFPDDAARWTGQKIGEVEDIPQDIEGGYDRAKWDVENKFDDAVQDVEDLPEDAAGWVGEKVGNVERFDDRVEDFGDDIQDSYDDGRDDARYGY